MYLYLVQLDYNILVGIVELLILLFIFACFKEKEYLRGPYRTLKPHQVSISNGVGPSVIWAPPVDQPKSGKISYSPNHKRLKWYQYWKSNLKTSSPNFLKCLFQHWLGDICQFPLFKNKEVHDSQYSQTPSGYYP